MPEVIQAISDERTRNDDYTPRGTINVSRFAEAERARAEEVQTRSDFASMADLIDRGVHAGYIAETVPTTFETIGFRRDTTDLGGPPGGGKGRDYSLSAPRIIPSVPEKGEYLPLDATESHYEFSTSKYGCQWDISWEAYLRDNRDLGLLMEYPMNWGLSARYTMQHVFTSTFAANSTFFTAARGNYAEGAATALDAESLDTALTMLQSFEDAAGNILPYAGRTFLVVPPVLERTARQLLNATFSLDGANVQLANLVNNTAELIVDPFLPAVDTDSGDTAWYLFADPALRKAVRYGYLTGHEQPEIFVKAAEVQGLMTGEEYPFDGTFLSDDIEFKLRFTFGADTADWRGAVMMKGA
jgi:hypothetical protein